MTQHERQVYEPEGAKAGLENDLTSRAPGHTGRRPEASSQHAPILSSSDGYRVLVPELPKCI